MADLVNLVNGNAIVPYVPIPSSPDDVADAVPPPPPWTAGDFSPTPREFVPHGGFYVQGAHTYRNVAGRSDQHVCGFAPMLLGELEIVNDLDDPASTTSRSLVVRISLPDGTSTVVTVPVEAGKNLSAAIIDAVPSALARCSVSKPNEVKQAAAAFTSASYSIRTMFKQTGWLPDGGFVFPGSEAVTHG